MRLRSIWAIGLFVVLAILIVPFQAQAFDFEETITIEEGGYHSRTFKVDGARILRFTITSEGGRGVDMLFLTPENFEKYINGTPFDYESGSEMGVISADKDFMLFPGDYHLVLDNSDRVGTVPEGEIQVSYRFWDYFPLGDLFDIILPITVTAVLIVFMVIIILFIVLGKNNSGKEEVAQDGIRNDFSKKR